MQRTILSAIAIGLIFASGLQTWGQEGEEREKEKAPLPKVLLLGDSISWGYAKEVERLLRDKAEVVQAGVEGGYTTPALEKLDEWLALADWQVIHFNYSLNDFEGAPPRISIEQYERNLRKMVRRLKEAKCDLIWCSTTPIVPGKLSSVRDYHDVVRYNKVARKVMEEQGRDQRSL
jgi:acyl-CoA thioesterase-1